MALTIICRREPRQELFEVKKYQGLTSREALKIHKAINSLLVLAADRGEIIPFNDRVKMIREAVKVRNEIAERI